MYPMDRGWIPVENIGHFVTNSIEVKRSFLIFRYVDECKQERDVIAKELGKTGAAGMTEELTLKKRIEAGRNAEFWVSHLPPHQSQSTTMPVTKQEK
ncbi:MAG: hypothetical protein IPK83_07720 [Planctomycetes bacterium]|nr:hypothetical protein [Planctomycetota bacterium]